MMLEFMGQNISGWKSSILWTKTFITNLLPAKLMWLLSQCSSNTLSCAVSAVWAPGGRGHGWAGLLGEALISKYLTVSCVRRLPRTEVDTLSREKRALTCRGKILNFKIYRYPLLDSCVSKLGFDLIEAFVWGCVGSSRGSVTRCKTEPWGFAPKPATSCGLTNIAEGSNECSRLGQGWHMAADLLWQVENMTRGNPFFIRLCCQFLFSCLRQQKADFPVRWWQEGWNM